MADAKKTHDQLVELRAAGNADLDAAVIAARKRIYQFRKDRLSKPQENVKVVKNSRKDIARALTIKREREIAAAKKG